MAETSRLLQIGEVAQLVGLSLRTVRYYEEVGLVTPSARSEGGFRLYSEADVERLRLLRPMKPLGLTLDEMRELAELLDRSAALPDLEPDELTRIVEGLAAHAERADAAIEKRERQLAEARRLRLRIGERLARSEIALEQIAATR